MNEEQKNRIEEIFRVSNSSEEIFDAVIESINEKIKDLDLYKILLANTVLSDDEIIMYTEKLCKEFKEFCKELYVWTAGLFENKCEDYSCIENAVNYYKKAIQKEPEDYLTYLRLLKLYNYEINLPINSTIIEVISANADKVKLRSKIYYALANHYKKLGDLYYQRKYLRLAEKYRLTGNQ